MTMQQYCLRWNNHQPNFISVFSNLLNSESLVDVTLAAEGKHLQAHKVVLSACSSYFQTLFTINPCQHPIVILKDVKFKDLKVMVEFMYYGEVNVSQDQLTHILKTAEMLKIKGLAEMPVDQTVKQPSNNTSTDRAELLTPSDLNWSSDAHRQSLSPSPCPLSPSARRKRLRKTSTGSNSGSGDRTSDEHPSEIMIPTPTGNIVGTIIKPESGSSDRSSTPQKLRQHSSDSELLRGSSHESTEGETHHQITLQVPQQTVTTQNVEASNLDVAGPSTSVSQQSVPEKPLSKTRAQYPQFLQQQHHHQQHIGTKRGRFLMRQHNIKTEIDPSHAADGDPLALPQHHLTVPPMRVERQCSEPLPSTVSSPPPANLLNVPPVLVKQHSHPLLPSQTQPPLSPPLHVQIMSHSQISDTAERAVSPVVMLSDPLITPHEVTLKADSAAVAPVTSLRVRTEELKRSASSPLTGTRSSHCPVVRPGPALGCNFCWNTVDTHGRILRRKTKYHCPECQTSLCIVPCFQEYHERVSGTTHDPTALTTSVMRVFPKTSSM
ncbi:longitudinals lacking protein, isoforms H/M/V isoform X1 [Aethina tumida]|uniref:longitudinals lacking protein, isoforms H/M/V isoform X1 n=1 Tax=Aethina tumida TaxID=116153 RepID=UPI00096AF7FD|nr:longitudinals lacking protein, isoforms H/M/V isoform X1 [Aethina tumida]